MRFLYGDIEFSNGFMLVLFWLVLIGVVLWFLVFKDFYDLLVMVMILSVLIVVFVIC